MVQGSLAPDLEKNSHHHNTFYQSVIIRGLSPFFRTFLLNGVGK